MAQIPPTLRRKGLLPGFSLLALALAAFVAAPLLADEPPLPLGGEILIPDVTSGDQLAPEVCSNEDGDFVAVWQAADGDGDGFGILAQLFDFEGGEVGLPVTVNATAAGDQTRPAISCDDSGDFMVAWESADAAGTGIFARRFEEDGSPDSPQVAVNATTAGTQSLPSIAAAENGDFFVVWQGPDAGGTGIWGRLFNDDGDPLTAEIQINATTAGDQQNPQVRAYDETGGYFVVWEGPDASGSGIFLRRLTGSGGFAGAESAVNDVTAGNQRNPALAISGIDNDLLDQNLFVVVWQSPDSAGGGIWARRYDDGGTPLELQQLVNDDDANEQSDPSVALDNGADDAAIDFVVTFTESPILGASASPLAGAPIFIRGRRLSGIPPSVGGLPQNAEFGVSLLGSATAASSVATEDNGDFVVVWQSDGQDGSAEGVYGRRFAGQPIFVDGFESGTTAEWSFTLP